jgi:oligopeptide/dipeptide ABC transporter ATP-binding protein
VRADPILEVRDLTVEYPTAEGRWRPVVDRVSLTVAVGERVGLVGESGSGKSVAALACLGLAVAPGRIRSGVISVSGTSLPAGESDQWYPIRGREIGMVFQEPSSALNPVYSIGFQLAEVLMCHRGLTRRQARAEAHRLLGEVGLEDVPRTFRCYPHQLSGGQLQRVTIALALAGQPRLLIADESTTGLDPILQAEVLSLIRRLTEDRLLGLLLVSHDLALVAGTVDRVIVMFAGQVVEHATAATLFANPLHPFTQSLLESAFGDGPIVAGSPDRGGPTADMGCRFAARCPIAIGRCRDVAPDLVDIGGDRALRCPVTAESLDAHGPPDEVSDG